MMFRLFDKTHALGRNYTCGLLRATREFESSFSVISHLQTAVSQITPCWPTLLRSRLPDKAPSQKVQEQVGTQHRGLNAIDHLTVSPPFAKACLIHVELMGPGPQTYRQRGTPSNRARTRYHRTKLSNVSTVRQH
jgi:hypothetical protein